MKKENFFASIILLTFNSEVYILETLESIRRQKFRDFEVIVADDGSKDKTRSICRDFFEKYQDEFKKITFLSEEPNMGTSANGNRGVQAASGKWIKLIAGDDILHEDCLQRLSEYDTADENALYCGQFIKFHTDSEGKRIASGTFPTEKEARFFNKTAKQQYNQLLTQSFNIAPAVFIRRSLFSEIGPFDERFRLLEDLPFWIKATEHGKKIYEIPHPVVYYRTNHESAVFAGEKFYNEIFMRGLFKFRDVVIYKKVPKYNVVFYQAELMERINYWVIINIFGNKKNHLSKTVSKIILFPTLKRLQNLVKK